VWLQSSTKCSKVFSFYSRDRPCHGLDDVLRRYRTLARSVKLSGPTNFAPLIYKAIDIVRKKDYSFHVLLIIADGQGEPHHHMEHKQSPEAFKGSASRALSCG
jgi:hypothetical protein